MNKHNLKVAEPKEWGKVIELGVYITYVTQGLVNFLNHSKICKSRDGKRQTHSSDPRRAKGPVPIWRWGLVRFREYVALSPQRYEVASSPDDDVDADVLLLENRYAQSQQETDGA